MPPRRLPLFFPVRVTSGSTSRAQTDFSFAGSSVWAFSYDFLLGNGSKIGNTYGTAWIGNFSIMTMRPGSAVSDLIVMNGWENSSYDSTFAAG